MPGRDMRVGTSCEDPSETKFRTGRIQAYRPDLGTYRVSLDGGSQCDARPVFNGTDKPYPAGVRVFCVAPPTSTWLILGEIKESLIKKPTDVPQIPAEAIYLKDLMLRRALHDRYDVTAANFSDPNQDPILDGDAEIANRKDARSYIRVDEGGNILSLASYYCFLFLSKVKNLIYVFARDSIISFAGFLLKTSMNETNKTATTRLSINSDPSDEGDKDVEITAGAIPTDDERPTKNYTSGSRISEGLYALFGTHALLEVDNKAKEIRLSHVDVQSGKDNSSARQQIRMNADEITVEWDDKKSIRIDKDGVEGTWEDSHFLLSKDEAALRRGDAGMSVNDKRVLLGWDTNNRVVVNKNGVQVRGLLEIVNGRVKFSTNTEDGVADGTKESVTISEQGNILNLALGGALTILNIESSFTVRNLGLVNTTFFDKYDADMQTIASHSHPVPPVLTAIPNLEGAIDLPPSAALETSLSSKAV